MRKFVLPIAVLALAGCGEDAENRGAAGDNAGVATAATGSIEERVASLEQRVVRLEQRLYRIEHTAVVVGPDDPAEGSEVPEPVAGQNSTNNALANTAQ